jgi:hypothetical protein
MNCTFPYNNEELQLMIMKPMQALPVVLYNRQLPLCEPMIAPFNSVIGVNGHGSELRTQKRT